MSVRSRRTVGATATVAALALIGGVAAQFTTSTTSAPQQIGTGTLALAIDSVDPMVWTDNISNLAAGDSVERFLDLRNAGSLKMAAISLSQTNTLGDLLTAPSDVSIKLQRCTVAWNTTTGACSGQTSMVLDSASVSAWGASTKSLGTFTDFAAGEVAKLKLTTTLKSTATNAVQNKSGTITYTFGGTQRTGGTNGTVSEASVPLQAPSNFVTNSSAPGSVTASWTDTNNGAAAYTLSWGETGNSAVAPSQVTVPAGTNSYTVTGLTPDKQYSFALNTEKSGASVNLATAATPVSAALAPSGLKATAGSQSMKLDWIDTNAGKATYSISAVPADKSATVTASVGTATTANLTGLKGGVAYAFEVIATKAGSSASAKITATPTSPVTAVDYTGSYQTYTVPTTGKYSIEAIGAGGGDATGYFATRPGYGARITATMNLTAGQQLKILTGAKGGTGTKSGGGGGGTYVATSANVPLVVAGGGGGEGGGWWYDSDAKTGNGTDGRLGTGTSENIYCYNVGGGGGFSNNGASAQNTYRFLYDGQGFLGGGSGGTTACGEGGPGGFGGGGTGGGGYFQGQGGNGGGYQGGSSYSASSVDKLNGGGGYSFIGNGAFDTGRYGAANAGNGKVTISYLG